MYFLPFFKFISRPSSVYFFFFGIWLPSISTTNRKRRALSGQPCIIHLCITKGFYVQPLLDRQASAL